jgi:hypothetical protein
MCYNKINFSHFFPRNSLRVRRKKYSLQMHHCLKLLSLCIVVLALATIKPLNYETLATCLKVYNGFFQQAFCHVLCLHLVLRLWPDNWLVSDQRILRSSSGSTTIF